MLIRLLTEPSSMWPIFINCWNVIRYGKSFAHPNTSCPSIWFTCSGTKLSWFSSFFCVCLVLKIDPRTVYLSVKCISCMCVFGFGIHVHEKPMNSTKWLGASSLCGCKGAITAPMHQNIAELEFWFVVPVTLRPCAQAASTLTLGCITSLLVGGSSWLPCVVSH